MWEITESSLQLCHIYVMPNSFLLSFVWSLVIWSNEARPKRWDYKNRTILWLEKKENKTNALRRMQSSTVGVLIGQKNQDGTEHWICRNRPWEKRQRDSLSKETGMNRFSQVMMPLEHQPWAALPFSLVCNGCLTHFPLPPHIKFLL